MAHKPIINPAVPFTSYLPFQSIQDATLTVNGRVNPNCDRFSINFEAENGDVLFHFNPRFQGNTGVVVRNTMQRGNWGNEERSGQAFPLRKGQPFEIMVLIAQQEYRVAVNGQHFIAYKHRIDKTLAKKLTINGNLTLAQIQFQEPYRAPPAMTPYQPPPAVMPMPPYQPPPQPGYNPYGNPPGQPVYNPVVPYNAPIGQILAPGTLIRITGQVKLNPSRFNVNLVAGPGLKQGADIGFHFDARIKYGQDKCVLVRNARQNGVFGNEERLSASFPFVPGTPFEILINCTDTKFMVAVNGTHLLEFAYRLYPLQRLDYLNIEGDVTVALVHVQASAPPPYSEPAVKPQPPTYYH